MTFVHKTSVSNTRPLRRCVIAGIITVVLWCASLSVSAMTAPPPLSITGRFAEAGLNWGAPEFALLHGIPLHSARFSSSRSPVSVAQSLSATQRGFQRILTSPGHIRLSGLDHPWHWLADIEAASNGARGQVSAMYIATAETLGNAVSTLQPAVPANPPWQPASGKLVFSHVAIGDTFPIAQFSYRLSSSDAAWRSRLDMRLRRHGWAPLKNTNDASVVSHWQRKRARLTLVTARAASGDYLHVHHTAAGDVP